LPRNYAATLSSELVSLTFIILAAGSWMVPNETRAQSSNESEVASPLTTVAATVRQNGYHCDRPERVNRDAEYSTPGEKAWIIDCGNGRFRVKYKGDTGAEVESLD